MNFTRIQKEVFYTDWSLRGISGTKWDNVYYEVQWDIQKFDLHTKIP